jgi:hypothetical protein
MKCAKVLLGLGELRAEALVPFCESLIRLAMTFCERG